MFAFVLFLPVFALCFLLKNRKALKNQILIKNYGVLYEEMKFEKVPAMLFHVIFCLRRLLMVLIIVLLNNYGFA